MKTIILAALLSAAATATLAQGRPATPQMSCRQAAGLVASSGAVVMTTGPDTYDRFVRDQSFCTRERTVQPARVPTVDDPACFIGYRCILAEPFNTVPAIPR